MGYNGFYTNNGSSDPSKIRGSELAQIQISRRLQSYGHRVIVFGETNIVCNDGVEWRQRSLFQDFLDKADPLETIIICVRYVHMFVDYAFTKPFKIYLWLHDYGLQHMWKGCELTNDGFTLLTNIWDKIYKVVCVGKEQQKRVEKRMSYVEDVHTKCLTIGNAIECITLPRIQNKIPFRFIWVSSWNRGLDKGSYHIIAMAT